MNIPSTKHRTAIRPPLEKIYFRRALRRKALETMIAMGALGAQPCIPAEASVDAATTITIPHDHDLSAGDRNSSFDGNSYILEVYSSAEFPTLEGGGLLRSVAFRADENLGGPFGVLYSHFELQLATFPYPLDFLDQISSSSQGGLEVNFTDAAVVFAHDNVQLSGVASTSPLVPSPFDVVLSFDKPFYYDPKGGNLILMIKTGNATITPGAGGLLDVQGAGTEPVPGIASFNGEKSQNLLFVTRFDAQPVPEPHSASIAALCLIVVVCHRICR